MYHEECIQTHFSDATNSVSGMTSSKHVLTNCTSNANYCVISNCLDFNGHVPKKVMTIQIFASILKILISLLVHDKDSE